MTYSEVSLSFTCHGCCYILFGCKNFRDSGRKIYWQEEFTFFYLVFRIFVETFSAVYYNVIWWNWRKCSVLHLTCCGCFHIWGGCKDFRGSCRKIYKNEKEEEGWKMLRFMKLCECGLISWWDDVFSLTCWC